MNEALQTRESIAPADTSGAPVGLLALDRQWRFRYVSDSLQHLFDQPVSEYLAKYLWAVAPQVNGTPLEHAIRNAMSDRAARTLRTTWPGTDVPCEIHIHPTARQLSIIVVEAGDAPGFDWRNCN